MKKLDGYILKKLYVTFFFCMLLFTVIAVAVDSSEKTDDFVRTGLSTSELITKYYFGFVPYIWGLLFPLFVFIAVIFFTSRMAARSEIIAILASGTSFNRFLLPFLLGGFSLAMLLWWGSQQLIPRANEIRADFQTQYLDKNDPYKNRNEGNGCYNCFYLKADSNTYIGITNYDTARKYAGGFFLDRIKGNKVVYNLRADYMEWDTAKKNWRLGNVIERVVDSMKEVVTRLPSKNITLNFRPDELRKDDYLKDKLTSAALRQFIRREELRGSEGLNALKIEQYRRTATPFSVLLLTFIGAVIASRKTRGGSGLHLALGIVIAAFFILSDRFSTVFSIKGNLNPLVAVWIPNVFFMGVAYWLYRKAPK